MEKSRKARARVPPTRKYHRTAIKTWPNFIVTYISFMTVRKTSRDFCTHTHTDTFLFYNQQYERSEKFVSVVYSLCREKYPITDITFVLHFIRRTFFFDNMNKLDAPRWLFATVFILAKRYAYIYTCVLPAYNKIRDV